MLDHFVGGKTAIVVASVRWSVVSTGKSQANMCASLSANCACCSICRLLKLDGSIACVGLQGHGTECLGVCSGLSWD